LTESATPRRLRLALRMMRAARSRRGRRPAPLWLVRAIRAIAGSSVAPAGRAASASRLHDEALRPLLAGVELGTWALGPRAIDEVVRTVRRLRPEALLEFGSGASTVAIAWAMREAWGPGGQPRVVSVEQDDAQAERTRRLLAGAGLAGDALVIVGPLAEQQIEGQSTTCYALPASLAEALGERRVDLVMIDGPAGPPGIRFGTLPLARPYVRPGATFLLDDALRDGELDIARRWSALPWVHIDGIRLIEKGLLVGTVTNP
jgi:hypothetical protein